MKTIGWLVIYNDGNGWRDEKDSCFFTEEKAWDEVWARKLSSFGREYEMARVVLEQ